MNKIKNAFNNKNTKTVLLSTLIFAILAHGFCYTNVIFSHDSIRTFFWTKFDTVAIGRYLIPVFLLIRGKYYPPLLIGITSYILLVAINLLLVDLFSITKKKNISLLSGIMTTASTLTLLNATYINFSDIYLVALFLATLGAYIWRNYKWGFIIAIVPIFLLLPIYQAYICFFTGIVLLLLAKDLMDGKKTKDIIAGKNGALTAIITFISSMLLYALSLKVVNFVLNTELRDSYNSVSGIGIYSGINQIIDLLLGTYKQFFHYIFNPNTYYSTLVCIFNALMIIFAICFCIAKITKAKDKAQRILLFVLFLVLTPLVFNFIYFLGKGVEHQLMIYALFLLYVFIVMLIEDSKFKEIKIPLLTILLSITIFSNIIYSNQIYLIKDLNTKTTLTTMNRIIDRLEQTPGYRIGETKISFIGNLNIGPLSIPRKEIDPEAVGVAGGNFGLTYYGTYKPFFENYLAYPINIVPEEEANTLKERYEVKSMGYFPDKTSIQFVDDILVIKLSE